MKADTARLWPIPSPALLAPDVTTWGSLAYATSTILAIAGIFTCLCDTPMIWDGAYQFAFSLIRQRPYFYLTRFHSWLLWWPMVALSHLTHNLTVLKLAYGLPFTLAPAASVLLSWWVVKRRAPHLIIWAIFGVAAAPLPGQIFIINDSIFQQHLFWPVYLGLLVPLDWRRILVLSVLVVFQFSHQVGLLLLIGGAGASALLAWRDRPHRAALLVKTCIALPLAAIAFWKIVHFPDSYAQREFTWERAHEAWRWGVEGYPLRGLEFMWAAGLAMLVHRALPASRAESHRGPLAFAAGFCVFAGAVTWTIWALDSHKWSTAVNYRRWVVPLSVPFYLLALIDAWIASRPKPLMAVAAPTSRSPQWIGMSVAAVFVLVLSIQSLVWLGLASHLSRDVESYPQPIVPWSAIGWTRDTALYHWGTASYVFVLEGQTPRRLVLDPLPADAARQLQMIHADPPEAPLSSFTAISPAPGPAGWFDFRPLVQQIRQPAQITQSPAHEGDDSR